MAGSDLALLARAVMDAPEPDAERQAEVVERAATVIEDGKPGQGQALEALAIVWNEEALRRAAVALKSRSQVTDFVERFTRDPYEAALDLLKESPTGAVISGVSVALRRTSRVASQGQLRRLFRRSVELISRKADGGGRDSSYDPIVQIALLGVRMAEHDVLHQGMSTLIDVQQTRLAYRLAIRYETSGETLDANISKRLVMELILHRVPYASCLQANSLHLPQVDWRSLQWLALANEAYDWVVGLAGSTGGPDHFADTWLRHVAHRVLRVCGGRKAGEVLQGVAGHETASTILRSMLLSLEIPPQEVGALSRWLGDNEPLRNCMDGYFELSVRRRCEAECYSQLGRCGEPGDLKSDLAERQIHFLLEEGKWEAALFVVYVADVKEKHAQLIIEAQEVLHPTAPAALSPSWGALVYDKFWADWTEAFRKQLLAHAETHAENIGVGVWGQSALEALREMLWERLQRLEGVVSRAACILAGIENEAREVVVGGIVNLIDGNDEELALAMAIEWDVTRQEIGLSDAHYAAVQEVVKRTAARLIGKGEMREAFAVCEAWDVSPQECVPKLARLSSGDVPADVVVAGSDEGAFAVSEVEAWFLARVRRGDVGRALSLRTSGLLRRGLHGTAVLAVLELFEIGRYKEAGQIIAAFELQHDFRAELEEIIPDLIGEGKIGIAEQLVEPLGPQYSRAFGDLILLTAKARLEEGEISNLIGLFNTTGMSFLLDEFKPVLTRYVEKALHDEMRIELRRIIETPALASMIESEEVLVRALEMSGARVPGTVTMVRERAYAFVVLSIAKLRVFVHRSVLTGAKMSEVKTGTRVVVAIKSNPKGPAATWATTTSDKDAAPEKQAVSREEDGRSLARLRDAWGARIRDAR